MLKKHFAPSQTAFHLSKLTTGVSACDVRLLTLAQGSQKVLVVNVQVAPSVKGKQHAQIMPFGTTFGGPLFILSQLLQCLCTAAAALDADMCSRGDRQVVGYKSWTYAATHALCLYAV